MSAAVAILTTSVARVSVPVKPRNARVSRARRIVRATRSSTSCSARRNSDALLLFLRLPVLLLVLGDFRLVLRVRRVSLRDVSLHLLQRIDGPPFGSKVGRVTDRILEIGDHPVGF